MGTFHGVVKQYGLHNLAPLIMLQAKLSIKICDTSCSCLPPYSLYIPSIIWPLLGECPYHVLPTYTGRKGGDWRVERAREKKSNNSGKISLYSYPDKEDHDFIQMFLLFY